MHQLQSTGDQPNLPMQDKLHPAQTLSHLNVTSLVALGLLAIACSSNNGGTGPSTGGGTSTSTGGTSASTGSNTAVATGGTSASSTGGQTGAQGGATGGTSNAASAAGGAATGGNFSSSVGGASATGGKSSSSAGGASAAGGKSSSSAGGSATGGASAAGGTSGDATGGASAAGGKSSTGGATAGGATNATGGATSAAGGTAAGGGSSCAAATITKVSGSDYQLKVCDLTLDVNPTVGARITHLTIKSTGSSTPTEIIVPYGCTGTYDANATCNSSGSTFWTSPQSAWDGDPAGSNNWPPVAAIDGGAYTVTDGGSTSGHLVLTGTADTTLGASVTKDFSADASTGWITVKYTIKATKAIKAAPWQITRVARGGLVFFPCSATPIKNSTPTWTVTQSAGYDWIDDSTQATSVVSADGSKIVVDAAAVSSQTYTYLGYALNSNLLLIKYPDVPSTSFAPNEADMEVYPGSGYMELEPQGVYTTMAANDILSWTVQWRVAPIDSSVTVAAKSASLITFAEGQAAK